MNAERGKCDQPRELREQAHYFDDGSPHQSCAGCGAVWLDAGRGQDLKVLRQRVVGCRGRVSSTSAVLAAQVIAHTISPPSAMAEIPIRGRMRLAKGTAHTA